MSQPAYKIEVWEPGGGVALYTLTDTVASIYFKEVLTEGVGHFNFTVPTVKGKPNPYYYNDIDLYDTVKIWLDYDSVSGNPDFIGKIYKISAPLSTQSGFIRQISGLSQGEILLRRLIAAKAWIGTGASTIVTELANDLGLGAGSIEADATAVTLFGVNETYFDILTKISDYWFDAVTQIKKDFYVDISNNLVWASRDGTAPFRSGSSVETFTVGDNIITYQVTRHIGEVANKIKVYGKFDSTAETPKDENWSESLTNWTANVGTLALDGADKQAGNNSIVCTAAADNGGFTSDFERTFLPEWAFISGNPNTKENSFKEIHYWLRTNQAPCNIITLLYAPDFANRYAVSDAILNANWVEKTYTLASMATVGSPNIDAITKVRFYGPSSGVGTWIKIDDLYFTEGRFYDIAEDGASQTSYGVREQRYISDRLKTDSDCERRGETLTYQKKDPPIQLDITAPGNPNVLVGDRLSQTIPAEDISAVNFDVVSVEQILSADGGWVTRFTTINTPNIRSPIPSSLVAKVISLKKMMRDLNREMYTMK